MLYTIKKTKIWAGYFPPKISLKSEFNLTSVLICEISVLSAAVLIPRDLILNRFFY